MRQLIRIIELYVKHYYILKLIKFLLKTIFSLIIVLVNVTSYALQTILSVAYEPERYLIPFKEQAL